MANINFIDTYIGYPGHPMFRNSELIEDDVARVIVQKYEMILFTNKGDVLGDPNFGGNLEELLHETRLSGETIEYELKSQISEYIPEINQIGYTLTVEFFDHPTDYIEYMVISFTLSGYEIITTVN